MKTCLFLIILLDFIQFIFCVVLTNVSEEICPVTWFRRKRANNEYTRWRSNVDTTSEFIVKVLDEDVPTSTTNPIIAVNILPVSKRTEKIIVGGAMLPLLSTSVSASIDQPREYTRFVPPTTRPKQNDAEPYQPQLPPITNVIPERIVKDAPFFFTPNSVPKNLYRDESPPASPQFIARVAIPTSAPARQYAPIAPVAFAKRFTIKPLTPPSGHHLTTESNKVPPTRSVPINKPTRTTIQEDFPFFQAFMDDESNENELFLTRTSTRAHLERTRHPKPPVFVEDEIEGSRSNLQSQNSAENKQQEVDRDDDKVVPDTNRIVSIKEADDYYYIDDYEEEKHESRRGEMYYNDKPKQSVNHVNSSIVAQVEELVNKSVNTYLGPLISSEDIIPSESELDVLPEENITEIEINARNSMLPLYADEKSRDKRRPVCNVLNLRPFNLNVPRTLPEIVAQLKQWAEDSPIVKWVDITGGNLTTMENPIFMMIIDDISVGQVASEKQNAFLVAGIHGRDQHAVTSVMYILYQLIERTSTHEDVLSKYRFYVIPVFNPDGYDYAMTLPHRREWVKNLRQTWDTCKNRESCQFCDTHSIRCTISPCYGVNLDRNFEYQWIPSVELKAEHPCGNLYAGTRQLSEPETYALSNYLEHLHVRMNVFIAFKEGDLLGVMYPYSHIRKRRPFDNLYRQKASRAAASAYSIAGRPYVAGQTSEFLPLYAGGIEDWADGHLGIDNVYTVVMFRFTDKHSKDLTQKVVHEAYAAMDSLLLSGINMQNQRPPIITLASTNAFSLRPSLLSITIASLFIFLY